MGKKDLMTYPARLEQRYRSGHQISQISGDARRLELCCVTGTRDGHNPVGNGRNCCVVMIWSGTLQNTEENIKARKIQMADLELKISKFAVLFFNKDWFRIEILTFAVSFFDKDWFRIEISKFTVLFFNKDWFRIKISNLLFCFLIRTDFFIYT